jgi:hypothetical protein
MHTYFKGTGTLYSLLIFFFDFFKNQTPQWLLSAVGPPGTLEKLNVKFVRFKGQGLIVCGYERWEQYDLNS